MADGSPISDESIASYFRGQDAERRRIGQELHDSTGQLLLALRLNILQLHREHDQSAPGGLLDEMSETIHAIESEIRTISFLHYPKELGAGGLAEALHSLMIGFGKRAGIHTELEIDPDAAGATHAVGQGLYRIAQEALVNVHRHARAERIAVRLKADRRSLQLTIDDDGIGLALGFKPEFHSGVGLSSMRQRAEIMGGQLSVHRLPRGTRVVAIVPAEQVAMTRSQCSPILENASFCSPPSRQSVVTGNSRAPIRAPTTAAPCLAELLTTL